MPNFESCSLSFPLSFAQVILRKPLKNEKPCVSWFIGDSLLFKSWDLQKNLSLVWDVQRTTVIGNGNTFISSPGALKPINTRVLWAWTDFGGVCGVPVRHSIVTFSLRRRGGFW